MSAHDLSTEFEAVVLAVGLIVPETQTYRVVVFAESIVR